MKKPNDKYDKTAMCAFLEAFDNEDLPDGAWWAVLEEGADAFADSVGLETYDANSMVHEYLRSR